MRGFLRKILDPASVNEKEFRKRYGLSKEAFNFVCAELQNKSLLRSSKRVKVEHKVSPVAFKLDFMKSGLYRKWDFIGNFLYQRNNF